MHEFFDVAIRHPGHEFGMVHRGAGKAGVCSQADHFGAPFDKTVFDGTGAKGMSGDGSAYIPGRSADGGV